jgi:hypothetical protein
MAYKSDGALLWYRQAKGGNITARSLTFASTPVVPVDGEKRGRYVYVAGDLTRVGDVPYDGYDGDMYITDFGKMKEPWECSESLPEHVGSYGVERWDVSCSGVLKSSGPGSDVFVVKYESDTGVSLLWCVCVC